MTEQTKTDAAKQTTAPAGPVGPDGSKGQIAGDLTVQDLGIIKSIIAAACQRGAFKANEMQAVGATYNKLESFLNVVQAQQKDLTKDSKGTPATATAKADANVNTQVGGKK